MESTHSIEDSITQLNLLDTSGISGISQFTVAQYDAFEKIGISGDLFREILIEYKRQGKNISEMQ